MVEIFAAVFLAGAGVELLTRVLLGLRFGMFGRKPFWDVIRYPIAVMDWRVFSGFGNIKKRASKKLFRFATQADEIGITADQLLAIMAKANAATPEEVFKQYSGPHGFEETHYRPFVGFQTRPHQQLSYVKTDGFGFQGEYQRLLKSPRTRRVLLLGGSVAFGKGCLSVEHNLTSKLEARLNEKEKKAGSKTRWEVINLAFISAQTISELNQAHIYSQIFSPDFIVQLSGWNDLNFFLLKQKLFMYHWQDRVIEYLASPLWVKCLDKITEYSFALRSLRKILNLRQQPAEGQLYTVW